MLKSSFAMNLSIVIPAFNEERRLPLSLKKIIKWLEDNRKLVGAYEVIVINDGSTDRTLDILKNTKRGCPNLKIITYKENKGKGYAVKNGILASKGDLVILTDADLSTPIDESRKIIDKYSKGVQVVAGSRFIEGSLVTKKAGKLRNFAATIFWIGVRLLLLRGVVDTQCGFKGFSNPEAKKIFRHIKSDSVLYDLEVFMLANKYKYTIKEVGVKWVHDSDSRLKYNLKKSTQVWLELFRLKFMYRVVFPVHINTL